MAGSATSVDAESTARNAWAPGDDIALPRMPVAHALVQEDLPAHRPRAPDGAGARDAAVSGRRARSGAALQP